MSDQFVCTNCDSIVNQNEDSCPVCGGKIFDSLEEVSPRIKEEVSSRIQDVYYGFKESWVFWVPFGIAFFLSFFSLLKNSNSEYDLFAAGLASLFIAAITGFIFAGLMLLYEILFKKLPQYDNNYLEREIQRYMAQRTFLFCVVVILLFTYYFIGIPSYREEKYWAWRQGFLEGADAVYQYIPNGTVTVEEEELYFWDFINHIENISEMNLSFSREEEKKIDYVFREGKTIDRLLAIGADNRDSP